MFKLVTREQARERGRKTYYTGEPCIRGHITERYTNNGDCLDCKKIKPRKHTNAAQEPSYPR